MEIDNEDLISLLLLVGTWIRLYSIFRHRQRMDLELLMRRRNFFHRLRRRRLVNLRRYQLRIMHIALLGVGLHHAIVLRRQQRSIWNGKLRHRSCWSRVTLILRAFTHGFLIPRSRSDLPQWVDQNLRIWSWMRELSHYKVDLEGWNRSGSDLLLDIKCESTLELLF